MRHLKTLLFLTFLSGFAVAEDKNILFILADDLSSQDLGCYGNEWFDTPNLDKLAAEGMRFTDAYSPAPICSASRASILTGKSTARLGFEFVTKNEAGYQPVNAPLRAPAFTLNLPREEASIAETLVSKDYESAFFGKWHLNQHYQRYLGWSPTHGPKSQGFRKAIEDFGSHPYSYWGQKKKRTFMKVPDGKYPVDSMTGHAIDFLKQPHEKPFFLMVSHFFVHTPVHTQVEWLHNETLKKIPADHHRRAELAHYGAMVTTLDFQVGELLRGLEDAGLKESTLVIFTADNGGHPDYAGNAPFRGSKWNLYEGGIRVPFIARWPEKIEAGSVSETPVIGTDLLPTFAEIAGVPVPENIDGRSILPVLTGDETNNEAPDLLWHFPYYHPEKGFDKAPAKIGTDDGYTSQTRPQSAMRSGPWKLIHFYESGRDELYHLESDEAEQKDRSQTDPEIAKELREKLDAKLKSVGARLPVPNPDYQKETAK